MGEDSFNCITRIAQVSFVNACKGLQGILQGDEYRAKKGEINNNPIFELVGYFIQWYAHTLQLLAPGRIVIYGASILMSISVVELFCCVLRICILLSTTTSERGRGSWNFYTSPSQNNSTSYALLCICPSYYFNCFLLFCNL